MLSDVKFPQNPLPPQVRPPTYYKATLAKAKRLIEQFGNAECRQTLSAFDLAIGYFEAEASDETPLTRAEITTTLTRDFRRCSNPATRLKIVERLAEMEGIELRQPDDYIPHSIDHDALRKALDEDD